MSERVTPTRQVALDVLRDVRAGDLADRALDRLGRDLDPRDFAWTQELIYGTLRLRGRIDYLLDRLVKHGTERLEADVLDVLRLGAYQILEMGSVPPYAAISQSVELVRWAQVGRAAGLVNGVLQSLLRRSAELSFPDFASEPIEHLCAWGSHPRWLIERWLARWGGEATRALVEANNRRPELFVRPIGMDRDSAREALLGGGVQSEPLSFAPNALRVLPPATARDALQLAPTVVQDPAAGLVIDHAAVPDGSMVVDLCAAPGGKAMAIAAGGGRVLAADLSAGRLRRLAQNVERLDLADRITMVVADGRFPPFASADVVLLDAPCTGTGTLRRHPDGRWRVSPQDVTALTRLQEELLDAAAGVVAPGGVLVYSTCSLEPEENEDQVAAFLDRHPSFAREAAIGSIDPALLGPNGDLMVLPQTFGVDGAYAARLRRTA